MQRGLSFMILVVIAVLLSFSQIVRAQLTSNDQTTAVKLPMRTFRGQPLVFEKSKQLGLENNVGMIELWFHPYSSTANNEGYQCLYVMGNTVHRSGPKALNAPAAIVKSRPELAESREADFFDARFALYVNPGTKTLALQIRDRIFPFPYDSGNVADFTEPELTHVAINFHRDSTVAFVNGNRGIILDGAQLGTGASSELSIGALSKNMKGLILVPGVRTETNTVEKLVSPFQGRLGGLRIWKTPINDQFLMRYENNPPVNWLYSQSAVDRRIQYPPWGYENASNVTGPRVSDLVGYSDFGNDRDELVVTDPVTGNWFSKTDPHKSPIVDLPEGLINLGPLCHVVGRKLFTIVPAIENKRGKYHIYVDGVFAGYMVAPDGNHARIKFTSVNGDNSSSVSLALSDFQGKPLEELRFYGAPKSLGKLTTSGGLVLVRPENSRAYKRKPTDDLFKLEYQTTGRNAMFKGYNIFEIDPATLKEGQCQNVIQAPGKWDWFLDGKHILPVGFRYIKHNDTAMKSLATATTSQREYVRSWSANLGISGGWGTKLSNDLGYSTNAGINSKFAQSVENLSSKESVVLTSRASHRIMTLALDPLKINLDPNFIQKVKSAAAKSGSDAVCDELLDEFGTHYAHGTTYGGLAWFKQEIDRTTMSHLKSKEVDVSAFVRIGNPNSPRFEANAGVTRGSVDKELEENSVTTGEVHMRGVSGNLQVNGDLSASAEVNQSTMEPISMDLRPISELLSPVYFDDPKIYLDLRERLRNALTRRAKAKNDKWRQEHNGNSYAKDRQFIIPPSPATFHVKLKSMNTNFDDDSSIRFGPEFGPLMTQRLWKRSKILSGELQLGLGYVLPPTKDRQNATPWKFEPLKEVPVTIWKTAPDELWDEWDEETRPWNGEIEANDFDNWGKYYDPAEPSKIISLDKYKIMYPELVEHGHVAFKDIPQNNFEHLQLKVDGSIVQKNSENIKIGVHKQKPQKFRDTDISFSAIERIPLAQTRSKYLANEQFARERSKDTLKNLKSWIDKFDLELQKADLKRIKMGEAEERIRRLTKDLSDYRERDQLATAFALYDHQVYELELARWNQSLLRGMKKPSDEMKSKAAQKITTARSRAEKAREKLVSPLLKALSNGIEDDIKAITNTTLSNKAVDGESEEKAVQVKIAMPIEASDRTKIKGKSDLLENVMLTFECWWEGDIGGSDVPWENPSRKALELYEEQLASNVRYVSRPIEGVDQAQGATVTAVLKNIFPSDNKKQSNINKSLEFFGERAPAYITATSPTGQMGFDYLVRENGEEVRPGEPLFSRSDIRERPVEMLKTLQTPTDQGWESEMHSVPLTTKFLQQSIDAAVMVQNFDQIHKNSGRVPMLKNLSGTWRDDWDGGQIKITQKANSFKAVLIDEKMPHSWKSATGTINGKAVSMLFFKDTNAQTRDGAKPFNLKVEENGMRLRFDSGDTWTKTYDAPNSQLFKYYFAGSQCLEVPFEPSVCVHTSFSPLFGDFDGDGCQDIFFMEGTNCFVYYSQQRQIVQIGTNHHHKVNIGDFNGDGLADVIRGDKAWDVLYSGPDSVKGWVRLKNWNHIKNGRYPANEKLFGDFDGDGISDAVTTDTNRTWISWKSTGEWERVADTKTPGAPLQIGYFNNDLKADLFQADGKAFKVLYGARGKWQTVVRGVAETTDQLRFGDLDGDGVTDIVKPNANSEKSGSWYSLLDESRKWRTLTVKTDPNILFANLDGTGPDDAFMNTPNWSVSFDSTSSFEPVKLGSRIGPIGFFFPDLPEKFLKSVDAAHLDGVQNKIHFYSGNDLVIYYAMDDGKYRVFEPYKSSFGGRNKYTKNWPTEFKKRIDAAFSIGGFVWLISGDQCLKFNTVKNAMALPEPGYPKPLAKEFPGIRFVRPVAVNSD